MPRDGKVPLEACDVLLDVNGVDVEPLLGKVPRDNQVLDVHADLVVVFLVGGNIFDVVPLLEVVNFCCGHFVVVIWLDAVDVVLVIFDVVFLVNVYDELLEFDAVGFDSSRCARCHRSCLAHTFLRCSLAMCG